MKNRIFCCDKEDEELRGPFSEREMQQQYRENKISLGARIYFTNGETPASTAKSYTLQDLRFYYGIGCPFIDPEALPNPIDRVPTADEIMIYARSEQKLSCLEEEIRELHEECDEVMRVEERIGQREERIMVDQQYWISEEQWELVIASAGGEKEEKKVAKSVNKPVNQRYEKPKAARGNAATTSAAGAAKRTVQPENRMRNRIFFREEDEDLRGPFNEHEMQQIYRAKMISLGARIYFTKGERPASTANSYTFMDLRSYCGIGCPFIDPESMPNPLNRVPSAEEMMLTNIIDPEFMPIHTVRPPTEEQIMKLGRLLEEIRALRVDCEGVLRVKERIAANVKKTPKELSKVSAAGAAKRSVQPENAEHTKWANQWAAYYLDVLEAYSNGEKGAKVGGRRGEEMFTLMTSKVLNSPQATQKCRDVLLQKLKEMEFFYCPICDVIYQDYKKILMHSLEPRHGVHKREGEIPTKNILTVMSVLFQSTLNKLLDDQEEHHRDDTQAMVDRFATTYGLGPPIASLRPEMSFVARLKASLGDVLCEYEKSCKTARAVVVAKIMSRLKQDDMYRKIMADLHNHIGNRQTGCYDCNEPTGPRDEYYKHLGSRHHYEMSPAMDLITLVVNMCKKDEE